MQSLFTRLRLAFQILKVQLCIPINHRVDTNKLQHRLSGVRFCIRDGCSLSISISLRNDIQIHAFRELASSHTRRT